jgi:hypothetical protein
MAIAAATFGIMSKNFLSISCSGSMVPPYPVN